MIENGHCNQTSSMSREMLLMASDTLDMDSTLRVSSGIVRAHDKIEVVVEDTAPDWHSLDIASSHFEEHPQKLSTVDSSARTAELPATVVLSSPLASRLGLADCAAVDAVAMLQ